jgi:uncharacterized protein YoxC
MHLVEYINFEIKPTEECFLIKPLRDLYNSDKSKYKEKFMQQLSVLYFLVDPRSSYNYMLDDKERLKEIIIQEGLPKDFKIDTKLSEAIDIYKKHTITSSYLLLQDTKVAIDKVRQFLRNIDLTMTDDRGKPVYTIQSITSAIKQIPQLAKDLVDAEKKITKEIEEQGRARGGNDSKSLFDDGIDLN